VPFIKSYTWKLLLERGAPACSPQEGNLSPVHQGCRGVLVCSSVATLPGRLPGPPVTWAGERVLGTVHSWGQRVLGTAHSWGQHILGDSAFLGTACSARPRAVVLHSRLLLRAFERRGVVCEQPPLELLQPIRSMIHELKSL